MEGILALSSAIPFAMIITLRPLRPVRALLRKDANQFNLFGGMDAVPLTPKAKARAKLYGNVAAPVVPKPKTTPKPTATPGKKPKEGDTRTNRAGNKEVLRGGRWRLADNPKVMAKPRAIVPVVEADESGPIPLTEEATRVTPVVGKRDFPQRLKQSEGFKAVEDAYNSQQVFDSGMGLGRVIIKRIGLPTKNKPYGTVKLQSMDTGETATVDLTTIASQLKTQAKPVDLQEADLVDEALPQVMPEDEPEITLEDLQEPGEEAMGEAGEAGGDKTREDRLNSDGVILGSYFVNQDWSSDEPGAKIVQELKLRKLQSSDYVRYNDSLNSGDRFVLERRFVRMNDVNGRTLEDEWRPVLFGASEDNLIATTEVKKIDEIADPKVQELADLRIKAEAEAKAAERAKEEQKAKEYQEYLDWENSHVQAQYAATKGKKQKVTINLVSEGGNKIDSKEVDATVYGKLAVHKSLERFSPGYVVTHIPSGMAVYRTEDLRHAHRVATTFHNEINWPDDPSNLSEEDRLKAKNIEEAFATLKKPNHIDLKASPVIRKKESKAKKPTLTKSLRPYPGPYLTLLGVRYVLDGDILRKAGMSWEDFRCEAEAMHKEAQGDDDPCWKGYEAVGLKRKGKRMVPNCVPVSR